MAIDMTTTFVFYIFLHLNNTTHTHINGESKLHHYRIKNVSRAQNNSKKPFVSIFVDKYGGQSPQTNRMMGIL